MKINTKRIRLILGMLAIWASTVVCSSGYITPGSVAATAAAEESLIPPTAFFIPPTAKPTDLPPPSSTPEPTEEFVEPSPTPTPLDSVSDTAPILYSAQSGDSIALVAIHFGVNPSDISSPQDIPKGLIPAGQLLIIPSVLTEISSNVRLIPDSEVIYSPSAIGFDPNRFSQELDGHLGGYREYLSNQWFNGGALIGKAATENSINPRLLLSLLQYQSNWLLGDPKSALMEKYPLGYINEQSTGLYSQTIWAIRQLSTGYYGWREGRLTDLTFPNGERLRLAPDLNAGTVAIQYLFSQLYNLPDWLKIMDKENGFPAHHADLFPDPWVRAAQTEPIFTNGLSQPELALPFYASNSWSFSSGPHGAWDRQGSLAALDFAPSSAEPGCVKSDSWITAVAPGLVIRLNTGLVVLDLDGDGNEQTGWVILYLHVSDENRVAVGTWLEKGDLIGFPSCLGGFSTASHLHISRKYNGEWINAAGPIPFNLSGWQAEFTGIAYQGTLIREDKIVTACTCGNPQTVIAKSSQDPY